MIYKYYSELKNRFLIISFSWIITGFIGYFYKEILIFFLLKPGIDNDFNSNISYFIYTNITDNYFIYFKVIFFISNQVFLFFFFYHFFMFISPGLYREEYLFIKQFLLYELVFVAVSLLFINSLLIPASLHFFFSFQKLILFFEATLQDYIKFYIFSYSICILNCQIFLVSIFVLNYLVKNKNSNLKHSRRFFYLLFVVFATALTPPDVLSQLVVSFCSVCIFEFSIFFYFCNVNYNKL